MVPVPTHTYVQYIDHDDTTILIFLFCSGLRGLFNESVHKSNIIALISKIEYFVIALPFVIGTMSAHLLLAFSMIFDDARPTGFLSDRKYSSIQRRMYCLLQREVRNQPHRSTKLDIMTQIRAPHFVKSEIWMRWWTL